ncbi:MAG: Holliday junction branch migration protein RuvA [Chloroflexi bacterium CFX4]|nr:Holliday junction branch migration protein RuvA [Chloroflexi bacterium CFX4]MDL1921413.1 Holliday junction branch migration protein RuvA [Chloroflexi bacterium CFX3]
MIERIGGHVVKNAKDSVVIMVGGVGLHVRVPRSVFEIAQLGAEVMLYTHLIVREDEISLYGFSSEDERAIFEVLITVSGVGAKIALAILSTLSADQLRLAVRRAEPDLLTRVPGIGKKTAEKIIFELKDKIGIAADALSELAAINDVDTDVIAALTSMGFSIVEAQSALQRLPRDAPQEVEARVLLALQNLG